MKRLINILVMAHLATLLLTPAVRAQDWETLAPMLLQQMGSGNMEIPQSVMRTTMLAQARADECFDGIGSPYPPIAPDGSCPQGVPKRNQAYVWGTTLSGNNIWFGTLANTLCYAAASFPGGPGTIPLDTQSFVCEGDAAASGTGDLRPPKVFRYNLNTKVLDDMTPAGGLGVDGIRSAGSTSEIVFMGGVDGGFFGNAASITLHAYNAVSGDYLGAQTYPQYNNIRKWLVVNGVLYFAVGNQGGGGSVLRWTGNLSNPFQFEVVGLLGNAGANLAQYGADRIAVTTWPSGAPGSVAGVFLSPAIPSGGLTAADAGSWTQVFSFAQYEPDLVTLGAYGGGDLAYFDGWLYWGSMHVPGINFAVHNLFFGDDSAPLFDALIGTWRAATVWRGRNLGTPSQEIQLLYGEEELARYDYNRFTHTGSKQFVMTPTGWTPLYGESGFGNRSNTYIWTMAVAADRLFLGTLDFSYVVGSLIDPNVPPEAEALARIYAGYGADIWRFDSSAAPAVLESRNGANNYVNYGIRTMNTSEDGERLFLGTANPFNVDPQGGWQLIELRPGLDWESSWSSREMWLKFKGWELGNRSEG